MKILAAAAFGFAALVVATLGTTAIGSHATFLSSTSWSGAIWGTPPPETDTFVLDDDRRSSATLVAVICTLRTAIDETRSVEVVAQTAQDCSDLGGAISAPTR